MCAYWGKKTAPLRDMSTAFPWILRALYKLTLIIIIIIITTPTAAQHILYVVIMHHTNHQQLLNTSCMSPSCITHNINSCPTHPVCCHHASHTTSTAARYILHSVILHHREKNLMRVAILQHKHHHHHQATMHAVILKDQNTIRTWNKNSVTHCPIQMVYDW